jgi:DNA (cytosine-5)-methyltransferase 1
MRNGVIGDEVTGTLQAHHESYSVNAMPHLIARPLTNRDGKGAMTDEGRDWNLVVAASLTAGTSAAAGVNPPGRRREDDINLVTTYSVYPESGQGADLVAREVEVAPALSAEGLAKANDRKTLVSYSTKLHNTRSNQAGKFYEEYAPGLQANSPAPAVAYPAALRGRDDGVELEVGDEDVYNALRAGDGGSSRQPFVAFMPHRTLQSDGTVEEGFAQRDVSDALHGPTGNKEPLIVSENQRGEVVETEVSHQLMAGGGKPGSGYPALRDGMAVRRLLPVECERLQGFPDGWTEGRSDSARYRLLGNAVCVPVARWIGARLAQESERTSQ